MCAPYTTGKINEKSLSLTPLALAMALEEAWLVLKREKPWRQPKYDRTGQVNLKPGLWQRITEGVKRQAGKGRLGRKAQALTNLQYQLQLPLDMENHRRILQQVYEEQGPDAYNKLLGEMHAHAETGKWTNDPSLGNRALRGALALEQQAPSYMTGQYGTQGEALNTGAVSGFDPEQSALPGSDNYGALQEHAQRLGVGPQGQQ